ncbi:hypothetical protein AJ78_06642 [Emergomyces pasteurianus Ep9510]|uniref:protein-histidine N-methyltransferase n=1 Tax=Emergomyces pasteurianus Ep9510 TaxID=1447872 RepID=A0A1J9PY50_9EURO|nr:hypothetical protein AJ78_06642 [Emergomyces pasteurianus Ep9510]
MSTFTFGFEGDDIDQDVEIEERDASINAGIRQLEIAGKQNEAEKNEEGEEEEGVLIEASYCDLDEMLSTLPSQISYSMLSICPQSSAPGIPSIAIPRREVFDIRAQLMAEDDADTNENSELISGLEKGDLKPNVYEGGLKTWECAIDLAKLVAVEEIPSLLSEIAEGENEVTYILELGAGTAIPSLSILHHLFSQPAPQSPRRRSIRFVFADYNAAVLRLVTVPNILLTWHTCRRHLHDPQQPEGEIPLDTECGTDADNSLKHNHIDNADNDEQPDLDIGSSLVSTFREDLHARGISLSFISGAWSPAFVELALPHHSLPSVSLPSPQRRTNLLILASETIYSPSSLRPFSETLLALLRRGNDMSSAFTSTYTTDAALPSEAVTEPTVTDEHAVWKSKTKALIAAKKVYFGVGGGVDEFLEVMKDVGCLGGNGGGEDGFFVKERAEVRDEGVGRVVLEVTVRG